ncbi:MAG: hypothetical protein HXS52_05790 [Theionarchaea archaeon]|nr:hypothetical protein [Theionarchaea archaeon]
MKKKAASVWLSVTALFVLSSSSLLACTSFAVYADRTFYGMNFDYDPSKDLMFCVTTMGDLKVFCMKLEWERDLFVPIAVMNSQGLFCNVQMVFPGVPGKISEDSDEMEMTELLEAAMMLSSCQDVASILHDHEMVTGMVSLHSLYADAYGDAMIVEVGQGDNLSTRIEGDFIVMTNFPCAEFAGEPYETVYGAGSDRYKTACRYLRDHAGAFDLEDGFSLLKSVVSHGTNASTRCSMLFDPGNNDVYLTLEGDFDKIWKISLLNETVETVRGFREHITMNIGEGVYLSELVAFESQPGSGPGGTVEPEAVPDSPFQRYVVLGLILVSAILVIGLGVKSRS